MPVYSDQIGRKIFINQAPQRIVSLVPSQTELLFHLGLGDRVVGITKFCVHPETWFRIKRRVGGTKTVHLEIVDSLEPDLIIANKEENTKEQIEQLQEKYPVWVSDIYRLEDSLDMIERIGEITGTISQAAGIKKAIENDFRTLNPIKHRPSVVYMIWKEPYMVAGGDTFIHDMLTRCGFYNVFAERRRYPEISVENLQLACPQFVFLSSEPYPFGQKHIDELQGHLPSSNIVLVDGEMFSWYGTRLRNAKKYFEDLIDRLAPSIQ
jgi:ABC-type Fe3+-hydroxamate transport system substrate-binding protein